MRRGIVPLAALVGLVAVSAGAANERDRQAIDTTCFEWGRALGSEISRARRDPDNDAAKAAGAAAAAYARKPERDEGSESFAGPANAFALEIYKLEPRKPETMGVYAYFVCQIHHLTDRALPTEREELDRIDALLARCETESGDDQALLRCVGAGIDTLVATFPPRQG